MFRAAVIVPSLEHGQHVELREFGRHHLIEAEDALGMIAQSMRAGDDGDLSLSRAHKTADQSPGRASGSDIVNTHVMVTARRRHIRHEGNHFRAAVDEVVYGRTDARMSDSD